MRLINLPRINDEVSTALGEFREERPVFPRVDGLTSTKGIVKIEQAGLPGHIQKFFVRYLRSASDAINVYELLGWIRIGTKRNGVYARRQIGALTPIRSLSGFTVWL